MSEKEQDYLTFLLAYQEWIKTQSLVLDYTVDQNIPHAIAEIRQRAWKAYCKARDVLFNVFCIKCGQPHSSSNEVCPTCRRAICSVCGNLFLKNKDTWTECSRHRKKQTKKDESHLSPYGV